MNQFFVNIGGHRRPDASSYELCGYHRAYNYYNHTQHDNTSDNDCVTIQPVGIGGGGGDGEQPCETNQWAPNGDYCDVFVMSRGREICGSMPVHVGRSNFRWAHLRYAMWRMPCVVRYPRALTLAA